MKVKLPYGHSVKKITFPDNSTIINPSYCKALADGKHSVFESFNNPISSKPLKDIISTGDRVAIVISDITRPTPSHKIVPWILEDVYLYSDLSDNDVLRIKIKPCKDISDLLVKLQKEHGEKTRIAVLPYGPQTIPYIVES